jgi:nitrite reductase/ring-hydroxylating ferredoxin subunit
MDFTVRDEHPGWLDVADGAEVVAGARFRVSASTHPGWEGEPVAVFCLSGSGGGSGGGSAEPLPEVERYAISDPCPHVAIGSLHDGDACAGLGELGDLEDMAGLNAAVLCPVHSYAFDLQTGHCITDKGRGTPSANIYRTRIITVNAGAAAAQKSSNANVLDGGGSNIRRVLQINMVPKDTAENTVSLTAGNKAQLHLVQLALERKYGTAEEEGDDDDLSDLLLSA